MPDVGAAPARLLPDIVRPDQPGRPRAGPAGRRTHGQRQGSLGGGAAARVLPGDEIDVELRGHGALQRTVSPILMGDREAEALLVCEVLTPAGHWSSYPPHKHDRDDPPGETLLEETYYHRLSPAGGFGLQRVYSDDRSLDEALAFGDGDCVLVPRGYHTVSAPPGYELYYLNVMAGPTRAWAVADDPDHAWTRDPTATPSR
jgi:5-deoxy-glucuronate isomerase